MNIDQWTATRARVAALLDEADPFAFLMEGCDLLAALVAEVEALRAVVACVRVEHAARAAWLRTVPPGSCTNPPPAALVAAEEATGRALAALDGEVTR